ncbi:MAG: DUF2508 family protein [Lachnospiraceae bacterium]
MKFYFNQKNVKEKESEDTAKTIQKSILEDIEKTRYELEIAYAGFDYAIDPDLIDCYIYEVNSVLKRYRYLLNQAAQLSMLPESKLDLNSSICLDKKSSIGVLVS